MAWDTRIAFITIFSNVSCIVGICAASGFPTNHIHQGQVGFASPLEFVELHGLPAHPWASMTTLNPGKMAAPARGMRDSLMGKRAHS